MMAGHPDPNNPPAVTFGYFGSGGRLFGALHAPRQPARPLAVVICNPLGTEALPAHRALRHLAEQCALGGFATLRFDYDGTGDSDGSDRDPGRVEQWTASIEEAIRFARSATGVSEVCLVGLRMGALLALAAARAERVQGVVLWASPPSGQRYIRELKVLAAATSSAAPDGDAGAFDAGGFLWTGETIAALRALRPNNLVPAEAPMVLVLNRDDLPEDASLALALQGGGSSVDARSVGGYSHVVTTPHFTEVPTATIDYVVDWIGRWAPPPAPSSNPGTGTLLPSMCVTTADGRRISEQAVGFGADECLRGILSSPSGSAVAPAVLLLAGSVHRIGHNRVQVPLARRLVADGHHVLRIDVGGLGDSPAHMGARENDPYPDSLVQDVEAAIAKLREASGGAPVALAGLCSGAFASFHGGLASPHVTHSVLINPLTFYWKAGMSLETPPSSHYEESSYYRQSVRDWRRWWRLLTGRSNLSAIAQVVARRVALLVRVRALRLLGWRDPLEVDLKQLLTKGAHLTFVFSVGEPGYDLLMTHAGTFVRRAVRRGSIALRMIDRADHNFTSTAKQEELIAVLRDVIST